MSFEEPLFHIHLNVDFPFNLTGILYFPRLKNNFEPQRNKIQLYSNQVFITDNVENIVPEFLTMLHGVIDSPDIPLNVSRSYLQADGNVKKISAHITKKVADKLHSMFKEDRKTFEEKWPDLRIFIEFGMLTDDKFYDKASKFALFTNSEQVTSTFEELQERLKPNQTDKNGNLVVLYAHDTTEQYSFVETAKEHGYEVMVFDSPLTSHYLGLLERKHEKVRFARVDADTIDKLIEKEEATSAKLSEDEQNKLKPVFEQVVEKDKFQVSFGNLRESDPPVVITQNEFMRRFREQQATGGGMMAMGGFPESYNLVVNANHPLVYKMAQENELTQQENLSRQLVDLALLSQGLLKGSALNQFIRRSVDLIQ